MFFELIVVLYIFEDSWLIQYLIGIVFVLVGIVRQQGLGCRLELNLSGWVFCLLSLTKAMLNYSNLVSKCLKRT